MAAISELRGFAMSALRRLRPRSLILMYHSVTTPGVDPWKLSVTPEHFAEQMDVIARRASPTSLLELIQQLGNGRVGRRGVVVTFDDGYANNLHEAAPRLAERSIPATVFIATGATDAAREFWWDELEQLLLGPERLPDNLHLDVQGGKTWDLGPAATLVPSDQGLAPAAPRGTRLALYHEVWQALQPLSDDERQRSLDVIAQWSGVRPTLRSTRRTMTSAEVLTLADTTGISIGAHTETHALLPSLSAEQQRLEIRTSRTFLEQLLKRRVETFSYPFGASTDDTRRLTRAEGFVGAVGTRATSVSRGSDSFELPRFDVKDWSGAEFEARLTNWLAAS
jgi:peptidoglycan/xylan/chitin deacetylase (PgdA/CDA1 family)